jgi:hypothetical protein
MPRSEGHSGQRLLFKNYFAKAGYWWLMPVTLAIPETEIRRIEV